MGKIIYKQKRDKIIITNKLVYPESVNDRIYSAVSSGMVEGLLPVNVIQKRKETWVECTIQGLTPLMEYFKGLVTKKMFLDFVYQIIVLIKTCEKNMINANNIDLQCDKVFVDEEAKIYKCVFWPVVNNQRETPPQMFFKNLPCEFTFYGHENQAYLEQYKAFFNDNTPFSINKFEKFILNLQGEYSNGNNRMPSEELSGQENKREQGGSNKNIEYNPFDEPKGETHLIQKEIQDDVGSIHCVSCGAKNNKGSNFCYSCGAKLQENSFTEVDNPPTVDFGTMVLGAAQGGTTVLGYDEPEPESILKLKRIRTGQSFVISGSRFRIGASPQANDLVISDNGYISGRHAEILVKGERYYIIDKISTNRTFVDGKVIRPEEEVEIFSGTEIRLANEDFTFVIEM